MGDRRDCPGWRLNEKLIPEQDGRPRLILVPPPTKLILPEHLVVGELKLDVTRRRAWRGHEALELTPIELGILEDLMRHPDEVRSVEQIAATLRKTLVEPRRQTPLRPDRLPPHVSRLRRKMDEKWPVNLILTVRGAGYRLLEAERQSSLVVHAGSHS